MPCTDELSAFQPNFYPLSKCGQKCSYRTFDLEARNVNEILHSSICICFISTVSKEVEIKPLPESGEIVPEDVCVCCGHFELRGASDRRSSERERYLLLQKHRK